MANKVEVLNRSKDNCVVIIDNKKYALQRCSKHRGCESCVGGGEGHDANVLCDSLAPYCGSLNSYYFKEVENVEPDQSALIADLSKLYAESLQRIVRLEERVDNLNQRLYNADVLNDMMF